jgi:nitrogenase molybdenum-iron protein alpha chain
MPLYLPECDKKVPERKKHIYIKDEKDEFTIPACNIATIPGDMTERGCTYAGCRGVVGGPVKDVIQLQHGPIGCCYYPWDARPHVAKGTNFQLANVFSTDLREPNIVFGGEKKLYDSIVESSKAFPDAQGVFVYATCVAGLIGDDIEAVAKRASKAIGKPVVAFSCPGFRGVSQSLGTTSVMKSSLTMLWAPRNPPKKPPTTSTSSASTTSVVMTGSSSHCWSP